MRYATTRISETDWRLRNHLTVLVPLVALYLTVCALWAMRVDPAALSLLALLPQWRPLERPVWSRRRRA